jgi:hypothetical protein
MSASPARSARPLSNERSRASMTSLLCTTLRHSLLIVSTNSSPQEAARRSTWKAGRSGRAGRAGRAQTISKALVPFLRWLVMNVGRIPTRPPWILGLCLRLALHTSRPQTLSISLSLLNIRQFSTIISRRRSFHADLDRAPKPWLI